MGWTGTHASYYKNGKVDRKKECDEYLTWNSETAEYKVLKSTMVGSIYYAAVEKVTENSREVIGAVIITRGQDKRNPYFNFHYKVVEETCGPCECKCPVSILKLLTPTDSEYAEDWRRRCYEYNEQKKNGNWLDNLPLGGKIVYTNWNGEEKVLIKHPPKYQFKKWFWFDEKNYKYISKKMITLNNSRPYDKEK